MESDGKTECVKSQLWQKNIPKYLHLDEIDEHPDILKGTIIKVNKSLHVPLINLLHRKCNRLEN